MEGMDFKVAELNNIPITYREGTYNIKEFHEDFEESIAFDYDAQYQILTYTIPVGKNNHDIRYQKRN